MKAGDSGIPYDICITPKKQISILRAGTNKKLVELRAFFNTSK
jgi:hypothetical protein